MDRSSQSTDLAVATTIRAERDRMAATIATLRARAVDLEARITEISLMRPGEEEVVEILERTARLLREKALKKLRSYLEPVIRGDANYAEHLPEVIVDQTRHPNWYLSEFPSELPVSLVDMKALTAEVMAYAGWQSPPLTQAERHRQLAELETERGTVYLDLERLKANCESLGILWPG